MNPLLLFVVAVIGSWCLAAVLLGVLWSTTGVRLRRRVGNRLRTEPTSDSTNPQQPEDESADKSRPVHAKRAYCTAPAPPHRHGDPFPDLDDLRMLGAAYLRAYVARDEAAMRSLTGTTSTRDLLSGVLINGEVLAMAFAASRGQSTVSLLEDFHRAAVSISYQR